LHPETTDASSGERAVARHSAASLSRSGHFKAARLVYGSMRELNQSSERAS
jgi:hypothetical protein